MTTNDKAVISAIDDEHETRWYVVNTYAGHENRVKENLEKRVETMGIQDSLLVRMENQRMLRQTYSQVTSSLK